MSRAQLSPVRTQIRVIGALVLREMLTRYGRKNIGFFWLFIEPMIFTVAIAGLWTLVRAHTVSSLPIIAFAVTGYSSVLLWRNMPSRCMHAIEANQSLMYHRQVKLFDIYISRLLLESAGVTLSFVALTLVFMALGLMAEPENALQVLFAWLLLTWFGMSLALTIGPLGERYPIVEKIWFPASYILFPLSGAAFILDSVPPGVRELLLYFPMVHGVEMLREGYFGSVFRSYYDVTYLAVTSAVLTFIGLAQVRIAGRGVVLQ